jgi:hemolysin activation/secretion protein
MGNGHWFLGGFLRYLDITQDLALNVEDIPGFNPDLEAKSLGVGAVLSHDTRDVPTNAYKGHYFQGQASTNDQTVGDRDPYQAYTLRYRTYHQLADSFVLAADAKGCKKHGELPLWDTCRLSLRGFPITEYLSKESFYVQAEARWMFYKRLGVVAFAGAGRVNDALGGNGEGDTIPSYGVGVRFMVLNSQRINVRVDYARSDQGREAWYLGVMEAF